MAMKHEMLCGAARTIMDGLKDAQMQYEWAEKAAEYGDHDIAMRHIAEAKKRLSGTAEWFSLLEKSEEAKMPLAKALLGHYKGWHEDLLRKVDHFHATAET